MMQSFAEHQKNKLRSQLYVVELRESFSLLFEGLKLDLVQSIKLPELLYEGNVSATAEYNAKRKEDYQLRRAIVEQFIQFCKANFYDALLEEAGAAVAASVTSPNPYQKFETDLIAAVQKMISDLKSEIQRILGAASNNGSPSASPASPSATPTAPSAGTNGASSNPITPSSTSSATANHTPSSYSASTGGHPHLPPGTKFEPDDAGGYHPVLPAGYKPADYGNFKPSDGVWGGVKRLFGAMVPKKLRQIWHGHRERPMAKECLDEIDMILTENINTDIDVALDNFTADIIRYIRTSIGILAKAATTGTAPGPLPMPSRNRTPKIAGEPVDASGAGNVVAPHDPTEDLAQAADQAGEKTPEGQPKGDQITGTDPNVAAGTGGTDIERRAAAGDEQAQHVVEKHYDNLMAGCSAIDIKADIKTKAWGMSKATHAPLENPTLSKSKIGVLVDGKPIAEKLGETGIVKTIYNRIYEKLMKQKLAHDDQKSLSVRVRRMVNDWLGLPELAHGNRINEVGLKVLLQLGRLVTARAISPDGTINQANMPKRQVFRQENPVAPTGPAAGKTIPATGGKPTPAINTLPATGQTPVSAPTALDGGSWPSDPHAFATKYKKEFPEEWAAFDEGGKGLTRTTAALAKHGDPKTVLTKIREFLNSKGVKTSSAAPTVPSPEEPAAPPIVGSGNVPAEDPGMAAPAPEPTVLPKTNHRDTVLADLKGDPDLASLADLLSSDELDAIIGTNNWDDEQGQAAIIDGIEKAASQKLQSSASSQGATDAGGTLPTPTKPEQTTGLGELEPDLEKIASGLASGAFGPESKKLFDGKAIDAGNFGSILKTIATRVRQGTADKPQNERDEIPAAYAAIKKNGINIDDFFKSSGIAAPTTPATPDLSDIGSGKIGSKTPKAPRIPVAPKPPKARGGAGILQQKLAGHTDGPIGDPDIKKIAAWLESPKGKDSLLSIRQVSDMIKDSQSNHTMRAELRKKVGSDWLNLTKGNDAAEDLGAGSKPIVQPSAPEDKATIVRPNIVPSVAPTIEKPIQNKNVATPPKVDAPANATDNLTGETGAAALASHPEFKNATKQLHDFLKHSLDDPFSAASRISAATKELENQVRNKKTTIGGAVKMMKDLLQQQKGKDDDVNSQIFGGNSDGPTSPTGPHLKGVEDDDAGAYTDEDPVSPEEEALHKRNAAIDKAAGNIGVQGASEDPIVPDQEDIDDKDAVAQGRSLSPEEIRATQLADLMKQQKEDEESGKKKKKKKKGKANENFEALVEKFLQATAEKHIDESKLIGPNKLLFA